MLKREDYMSLFSLSARGQAMKYVVLTTKLVQVLHKVEKKSDISDNDNQVLSQGKVLLKSITEGALLVEGKEIADLSPSQEGLAAYGYALSTIDALQLMVTDDDFSNFFKTLYDQIDGLNTGQVSIEKIQILKKFFLSLGQSFRDDIQKEKYAPHIIKMKQAVNSKHALSFT
jgi:hypothetical protein